MPDPLVMSSSSLSTMLRCGLQWKFAYVDRIKSPPSLRALIGIAAHEAVLDTNLAQKIESKVDLPMADVLDSYSTAFDRGAPEVEKFEEPIAKGKDSGAMMVRLHHKEIAPTLTPLAVEKQAKFTINGNAYSTYIDAVTEEPGGKRVRELKTTLRRDDGAKHTFQLIGGTLAERQNTGEIEEGMELDTLVRTIKPQYNPIVFGPLTGNQISVFSKQVETANQMAKTGLFPANGITNGACSWCGYTSLCPAYKAAFGSRRL